jgi:hypothetical protein
MILFLSGCDFSQPIKTPVNPLSSVEPTIIASKMTSPSPEIGGTIEAKTPSIEMYDPTYPFISYKNNIAIIDYYNGMKSVGRDEMLGIDVYCDDNEEDCGLRKLADIGVWKRDLVTPFFFEKIPTAYMNIRCVYLGAGTYLKQTIFSIDVLPELEDSELQTSLEELDYKADIQLIFNNGNTLILPSYLGSDGMENWYSVIEQTQEIFDVMKTSTEMELTFYPVDSENALINSNLTGFLSAKFSIEGIYQELPNVFAKCQ